MFYSQIYQHSGRILVMTIKERIDTDIKNAMLSGDKKLTTILRTLKSVALNMEVEKGLRDAGLGDEDFISLLGREAKKRQESAEMYVKGGSKERADAELNEYKIIQQYLPEQLSDVDLNDLVEKVIKDLGASGLQAMGKVIGEVKKRSAGQADGGKIAQIVKEKLT